MSTIDDEPSPDGIHHVKPPVADLQRSGEWWSSGLGYRPLICVTRHGRGTGLVMGHPDGGPMLSFVHDPGRAARFAGFDYFSIGVRDKATPTGTSSADLRPRPHAPPRDPRLTSPETIPEVGRAADT
jgi:catechol 2,3-dioxygenase-like lactoylglutathione lyase family enzyme